MALSKEVWDSAVDLARGEIRAMQKDFEELAVEHDGDYWRSHANRCSTALDRLDSDRWTHEMMATINNVLSRLDEEDVRLGYRESSLCDSIDRHMRYSGINGAARHFEKLALICSMEKGDVSMDEAVANALASGRIMGPIPAFQDQQAINLACAHRGSELFLASCKLVESRASLGVGYFDLRAYEADGISGDWFMTNRAVSSTSGDLKEYAMGTLATVQPLSVLEGSIVEMVEVPDDLFRTVLEGEPLAVAACIDLLAEKLGPDVDLSIPTAYRDEIASLRADNGIEELMSMAQETAALSSEERCPRRSESIEKPYDR